MLRSSVSRDKLVIYTLGSVLSLYLSYRGGAIRKLVLEYKFWPKSPMYDHSTTLKLVISGHRYPNSFQCFRYFHSLLFFLLHFCIVYRGGAIRKLVLEYKFWPKSPMYDHSTTLKLVISGHRYPNSFQCFRYFHSLLFFLLHFCIVYLFPGWNLMVGVKVVLRRPVVRD